jgi:cellulose synthase/poly-beta-1,6-N-acetylglucosamine synthase-like glycosyltransferase
MIWILVTIVVNLGYLGLIVYYHRQLIRPVSFPELAESAKSPMVSVVIVGRNEDDHIPACLSGIYQNDYPKENFEVIYVDDHSTDASIQLLQKWETKGLQLLQLADHVEGKATKNFKKKGIALALNHARGDLILHTDADTIVGRHWIRQHAISHHMGHVFSAAPVFMIEERGFLAHFQQLDFLVTMAVTAAGIRSGLHYLANGANMSYDLEARKQIREESGRNFASGDDVFLVQAFGLKKRAYDFAKASSEKMTDEGVSFLHSTKSAVYTYPETSWKAFFNQRFRWAGKSSAYRDKRLLGIEALVFIVNVLLLINFFFVFILPGWLLVFAGQLLFKGLLDVWFIVAAARKWHQKTDSNYLLPALLFYPLYYLIVGISALIPIKKTWKGRAIGR